MSMGTGLTPDEITIILDGAIMDVNNLINELFENIPHEIKDESEPNENKN